MPEVSSIYRIVPANERHVAKKKMRRLQESRSAPVSRMHHHLLTYIGHVEKQKAGSCLGDYTDPSWIMLVRVAACLLYLVSVGAS
jgi:hypothetical protein